MVRGATVSDVTRHGDEYAVVRLEVPAEVADGFHVPGQYHRLAMAQGVAAPFAIASPPGSRRFEYLVRPNGGVSTALFEARAGQVVEVAPVEGAGFPLGRAHGRPLVLVGTGSGFAPLRSALLALEAGDLAPTEVAVVWGVRTGEALPFTADLARWRARGFTVTVTASRPGPRWTGPVGHAQVVLGPLLGSRTVAFVCGQAALLDDVRAMLASAGGAPTDAVTNH